MRAISALVTPSTSRSPAGARAYQAHAAQAIILAAVAAGGFAGLLETPASGTVHAIAVSGADFARLIRAMAAIKAVMALAAGAAVMWRLAVPAGAARLAAYTASCAAMAAGPGLIWGMVHIASGALLLHGGLIAAIVLLWRDPAVGARLATLVAARKRQAVLF